MRRESLQILARSGRVHVYIFVFAADQYVPAIVHEQHAEEDILGESAGYKIGHRSRLTKCDGVSILSYCVLLVASNLQLSSCVSVVGCLYCDRIFFAFSWLVIVLSARPL